MAQTQRRMRRDGDHSTAPPEAPVDACVDLETGEQKWKGERYNFGQVMLVGDVIVVQAEDGPVALVEANPDEFQELARIPALKAKTWNNPVVSGSYLLVRNDKEAVCYQLSVESER